jgi:hypothetical protein
MSKKLMIAATLAVFATRAFADPLSIPGELGSPQRAAPGATSGYVAPTMQGINPGLQGGMNWTSRSGNTAIGGYSRIEGGPVGHPNVQGGIGGAFHF